MYKAKIGTSIYEIEFEHKSITTGKINGKDFSLDATGNFSGDFNIIFNFSSHSVTVEAVNFDKKIVNLRLDGQLLSVELSDEHDELLKNMGMTKHNQEVVKDIKSPMPGLVTKILVREGTAVKKGDLLVVLEAMKMENNIKALCDCTVNKIFCTQGKAVEKNEILLDFK